MPYIAPAERIYKFEYDFARHGGVAGTIAMDGIPVPSGAVVTDSLLVCDTPSAGGDANTIALTLQGAGDVQTAAARNGAPWNASTPVHGTLVATGAPILTTADRTLSTVIAVTNETAGAWTVYLTVLERD